MSAYKYHLSTIFASFLSPGYLENENDVIRNILLGNSVFSENKYDLLPILLSDYVREVWISETPPKNGDIDTVETSDALISSNERPANVDVETWCKLQNIYGAINYIIENTLSIEMILSKDFIKDIHNRLAANNIIRGGGVFRTIQVTANQSSVMYCRPQYIEDRLSVLLSFIKDKYDEMTSLCEEERLRRILCLGGLLFSEFLLIHPFRDGNGRTARILLNAFMKDVVVVPFSLYFCGREKYLEALEMRNNLQPPHQLVHYLLLACNRTAANVNWLCMK